MTIVTLAVAGGAALFWIVGLRLMIPTWVEVAEFCRNIFHHPGNYPFAICYAAFGATALLVPTIDRDNDEAGPETAFGYWGNAFLWLAFGLVIAALIGDPTDKDAIAIGFLAIIAVSIPLRRKDYRDRISFAKN